MSDTQYTQGFKAGLDWNRKRTIELLEQLIIAIQGQQNQFTYWQLCRFYLRKSGNKGFY